LISSLFRLAARRGRITKRSARPWN